MEDADDQVVDTQEDSAAVPAAQPASLRDELSAAYDAQTKPEPAEDKPAPVSVEADPNEPRVVSELGTVPSDPALATDPIPHHLKGKLDTQWAALPPEVKSAFHEYESNIGRIANRYGRGAKNWERAEQAFAPYAEMVQSEGGDYHTAVTNLFETARILRAGHPEQKIGLAHTLVKNFGIPHRLNPDGSMTVAPTRSDPALLERMTNLESQHSTRAAQQNYDVQQVVDQTLDSFVNDPQNVYLREPGYLDTMAMLIETGKARDLADAYTQAAWLHEGSRALEIAKRNQSRVQAQQQTAARAKAAGVSVNGNATGTPRVDPSKMSTRETLEAAWNGELDN